jgi:hypothetical protein
MSGLDYLWLTLGGALVGTVAFLCICRWYRKKYVRSAPLETKLLWAAACATVVCLAISLVQKVDGYHRSDRDLAREMGMD